MNILFVLFLFVFLGLLTALILVLVNNSPYKLSGVRIDGDAQEAVTLTMTSSNGKVETLVVLHGTAFTFHHRFKKNEGYVITASDPECTILNGSGTFSTSSISNVVVECYDQKPTLACVNQTGVNVSAVHLLLSFAAEDEKIPDTAILTIDGVEQKDLVVTDMDNDQFDVADIVFPGNGVFEVVAQLYMGTTAVSGPSEPFVVFLSDATVPVISAGSAPNAGEAKLVGTFGSAADVELYISMDPDTSGCNIVSGGPYVTTAGGAFDITLTGIAAGSHDFVIRGETGAGEKTGSSVVETIVVT